MPRVEALANRIADAVIARLQTINSPVDAEKWLNTPRTIVRGLRADWNAIERPALVVVLGEAVAPTRFAGIHQYELPIEIHCFTRDVDDPERAILNLAADVLYALAQDESLGGLLIEPPGQIVPGKPDYDAAQSGIGATTIRFTAVSEYDHAALKP